MLGSRLASAAVFCLLVLGLRPRVRVTRSALPVIIAVGVLGTAANGFLAVATAQGYLSLVAVLSSLYPVVTVLLAYVVVHERMAVHQVAGALAALAGVALIAV